MRRDIDLIAERLRAELPGVLITQLQTSHPADDDGIWFIRMPGRTSEVQIESAQGQCPFLIESAGSDERIDAHTVEEVVSIVRAWYD